MKKALSFLLTVVLVFALAVPAFAEGDVTNDAGDGSASQAVTAKFEGASEDTDVATVYFVTVGWEVKSDLKYSDGTTTYTWNATDTKYEAGIEGKGWTGGATVGITVTNQSNADITATASWANAEGITAACTFEAATVDVESAAKDVTVAAEAKGAPKTGTISASVAAPTAGTIDTENATVGTITVNIAKKP